MRTLIYALLLIPAICPAQDESGKFFKLKEAPKAVQEQMLASIPLRNDKIFYDTVMHTDTLLTKAVLFTRIRQWLSENFTDSKDIFTIDDSDRGRLSADCIYRYEKFPVVYTQYNYLKFKVNVAIKDGKFEFQMYDFNTDEKDVSTFATTDPVQSYVIQFDELYRLYRDGKKQKSAKAYLNKMTDFVYFVNTTLPEVVKKDSN